MKLDMRRDEWPARLFKLRGFGRVDIHYDRQSGRMVVTLARSTDGQPVTIALPDDYRTMTLEAFRNWVDDEVAKLFGASDFPPISFRPVTA